MKAVMQLGLDSFGAWIAGSRAAGANALLVRPVAKRFYPPEISEAAAFIRELARRKEAKVAELTTR